MWLVVTTFSAIARIRRRGWLGYAEELAGHSDISGPVGIGEEAVMTDAVEPVGQYVDQEAADELVGVERHELVAGVALGPVILPFESHALAVEGNEPAVGNSDPVSVAGQVGEDSLGSAKRPLGIDHPFDFSQCGNVGFEARWLGQGDLVAEELQAPELVSGGQPLQEQTAEQA